MTIAMPGFKDYWNNFHLKVIAGIMKTRNLTFKDAYTLIHADKTEFDAFPNLGREIDEQVDRTTFYEISIYDHNGEYVETLP